MENLSIKIEGFSKNLITNEGENYYLSHQKILTFVDKVSNDEIMQLLDAILEIMRKRLGEKIPLVNLSSIGIEELGKNSKIFLVSGTNIHLMNKHDTGILGGKTPPPKPPPIDINNNTLNVFGDRVFTLSHIYKHIESNAIKI